MDSKELIEAQFANRQPTGDELAQRGLDIYECCQPDYDYERGQYVHNDDCTGENS